MPTPSKSDPSPRSMKAVQMEAERLWRKGFVEQMSFKSGMKGQGSQVGWLWEFIGEWEEFIFIAFINLEPVQRSADGCGGDQ